jgi:hypothetical protein
MAQLAGVKTKVMKQTKQLVKAQTLDELRQV